MRCHRASTVQKMHSILLVLVQLQLVFAGQIADEPRTTEEVPLVPKSECTHLLVRVMIKSVNCHLSQTFSISHGLPSKVSQHHCGQIR
jgi:hypothetical protein